MAKDPQTVVPDVRNILDIASSYIGKLADEDFNVSNFSFLVESEMSSPIEQALCVALFTVMEFNHISESEPMDYKYMGPGICVSPQYKIGKYRADFHLARYVYDDENTKIFREVVVECDGTAFHERTEPERRAEKARDRFMQKMNLKVFRYTGKEIMEDPFKVAAEIIGYLQDDEANTITPQQYFE